ncbi:kinase-like domain-containing protein [Umbelopsis sp. AD052]|nr:kinase-like domain-containing protein [Umbelopsis sp. AD052]
MSSTEFTSHFEPLEVCGSGSFGLIRKVRRISDGQILACKEIDYRKMSEKEKRQLVAEVNILRELKHPNIVRYYERIIDRKNCMLYILMEYCDGGDLSSVIRKCKQEGKYLQEDVIWILLTQMLLALRECHHGKSGREESKSSVAILHRDLKPDNVFLDDQRNVKLGDFGLSRTLSAGADMARTFVGTPFYMSPELINESSYDMKSDVWALGCLTFELCALEPPFQAKTQHALATKIKSGKTGSFPKQYSPQLHSMIKAMMHTNVSDESMLIVIWRN